MRCRFILCGHVCPLFFLWIYNDGIETLSDGYFGPVSNFTPCWLM